MFGTLPDFPLCIPSFCWTWSVFFIVNCNCTVWCLVKTFKFVANYCKFGGWRPRNRSWCLNWKKTHGEQYPQALKYDLTLGTLCQTCIAPTHWLRPQSEELPIVYPFPSPSRPVCPRPWCFSLQNIAQTHVLLPVTTTATPNPSHCHFSPEQVNDLITGPSPRHYYCYPKSKPLSFLTWTSQWPHHWSFSFHSCPYHPFLTLHSGYLVEM
jgi:hypothetical protein